jgi:aminopeptidase N
VVVFVRPSVAGEVDAMARGTAHLVREFEFLEDMLGAYPYGDEVGSVAAPWPPGSYGGMEHHPYWHVAAAELHDTSVHAHEAAHGWFGNGIRVSCWEDLVLSEGFATYLEGRAKEAAAGAESAALLWAGLETEWTMMGKDGAAPRAWWPESCDADDPITAGYYNSAPYVRGAMFLRALERKLGRDDFDAAVRAFVAAHLGKARRLADFLEHVRERTGFDPRPCAEAWLVSGTLPTADRCVDATP